MSDDEPKFGYGLGRRPLWSERDRDAERVRDTLRGTGLMEFSDGRNDFVVEGGGTGQPFLVAFTGLTNGAREQVGTYAVALRSAGMRVEPDSDDDQNLQVWLVA
ncbi:hypothetical protein [Streptosporangium sp. CA-115845]|uniref:hypothetical protein n=1 Tax=Streptosporangium sp. CA-115845 TaxID=3240071 RepID=UPI003D9431BA